MAYKNPVPYLGGKRWCLEITFNYEDWIEAHDVKRSLEEYIAENGIPKECLKNITPIEEYK